MCGIAGAVSTVEIDLDPRALDRMADVLRHRGPDDRGFLDEPFAKLVSTRLSIIDLAHGHMPISNEDGSLHIVYNGECFNFGELRPGLEARGHVFRTHTDTEVVLHLFEEHGPACLGMMNGQYAFAVWNSRERSLFLGRDRMGIKPLYYAELGGTLVFASEIKAILASGLVRPEPDLMGIDSLTNFACVVAPRTCFKGVRSLAPSHHLEWKAGRSEVRRYWDIPFPEAGQVEDRPESYWADGLRERLTVATRRRLISDVPLGAYLSGGIDSSCIVDRMSELHDGKLTTFSILFTDRQYDESRYVRLMAERVGAENRAITCDGEEIARAFPRLMWQAEMPMISTESAPLMLLSGEARKRVKVVLTGEGADELFGGYSFDRFEKLRRRLGRLPWAFLAPFVRMFFERRTGPYKGSFFPPKPLERERERLFGVYPSRSMEYGFLDVVRRMVYSRDMLARSESYDKRELLDIDRARVARMDPFNASLYLSSRLFLEGHLLAGHGDRAAMANSIEARFPFLDPEVVEFCARIPPELKMRGTFEKYILRAAFRDRLPREILARRKQPFVAPFGTPFFGPGMSDEARELLSDRAIAEKGYFDPAKVRRVIARLRELDARSAGRREGQIMQLSRDSMERLLLGIAVTLVVSVQIWDEAFFSGATWMREVPSSLG